MAKKIRFETEVDPGGFDRGIRLIEAQAAASNGRMNRTVYEAQKRAGEMNKAQINARVEYQERQERKAAGKASFEARRASQMAAQPTDVIPNNAGSGFTTGSGTHQFTRRDKMGRGHNFGVASSMFVSVARDSAASLASGAPLLQVMAQQGPQVLQAVTMIGGGIMKWGLGIGVAVAGLVGFHYATKKYFELWASGWSDQEARMASLDRRGEKLRAFVAEQRADRAKAVEAAKAEADVLEKIAETRGEIGLTRSQTREAQAGSPEATQRMVIARLRQDEENAIRKAKESGNLEFIPGRQDLRLKALQDQLAAAKATGARVDAENALRGMTANSGGGLNPVSDSLTSVGNFLGAGRGMVDSIAQQQLSEQKTANRHHDTANKILNKIAERLPSAGSGGGIEVPGS